MSAHGDGIRQLRHRAILLQLEVLFDGVNVLLLDHLLVLALLFLLESGLVTRGVLRADGHEIPNLHFCARLGGISRNRVGPFAFDDGLTKQEAGFFESGKCGQCQVDQNLVKAYGKKWPNRRAYEICWASGS